MIEKRLNYSDLQKSVKESRGAKFIETKMILPKRVVYYGSLNDVWSVFMTGKIRNVITVRVPDLMFPVTFILGRSLNPSGTLVRLFSIISISAR